MQVDAIPAKGVTTESRHEFVLYAIQANRAADRAAATRIPQCTLKPLLVLEEAIRFPVMDTFSSLRRHKLRFAADDKDLQAVCKARRLYLTCARGGKHGRKEKEKN